MLYRSKIYRICLNAMLLGLSLVLSYLEAVLPLTVWIPLPGFKLGLCNIMITLIFVTISPVDAAMVSLCRVLIMGMLFGNAASFTFSLSGALLSYLGLWLLARLGNRVFSMVGISVGCAVLHNIGQLIAASAWFGIDAVFGYLPFLMISSLLFGSVTGILLHVIVPRFNKVKHIK